QHSGRVFYAGFKGGQYSPEYPLVQLFKRSGSILEAADHQTALSTELIRLNEVVLSDMLLKKVALYLH
uniref:hypothetical protein n=1 Tax=Rhodohalobacter sp. 8-1 TaxID=3131972 RepID=UPI0030EC10CF